jgi:copper(I)-binding protein
MRRLLLACALLAPVPVLAQTPSIEVTQPWARATPGAARSGAVYFTITDHGAADTLTGVSTPAAGMAMLHESFMDNGVSKMRMLGSVNLPTNTPVTLAPGGMHIMLTDLAAPLRAGGSFPITLSFAHAAPVTVNVPVLKVGAPGPAKADDMGDMPGMTK